MRGSHGSGQWCEGFCDAAFPGISVFARGEWFLHLCGDPCAGGEKTRSRWVSLLVLPDAGSFSAVLQCMRRRMRMEKQRKRRKILMSAMIPLILIMIGSLFFRNDAREVFSCMHSVFFSEFSSLRPYKEMNVCRVHRDKTCAGGERKCHSALALFVRVCSVFRF